MRKSPPPASEPPGEVAAVTPRDLHPTSDIRFVMVEVGKLTANVDRLIADVKAQGALLERKAQESAVENTKICDRLTQAESSLGGVVRAQGAPWWKRMEPASMLLAAVGIVTLVLTILLGNGRFEDVSKRLDQSDKSATLVEQRSDRLEDRINGKLDQIQQDLAMLKARPVAPVKP